MICQKYIARCYRVYQHERNENASFLSIFNGSGRPKWRFSNFPWFWKNPSALGSFNCIFENNSLKALFGQNMKKLKILKLSPDSRYLQKLALKLTMCSALYLRCQILWIRWIDQHYRWSTIYIVVFTSESVWKGICIHMKEMECMELHAWRFRAP